MSSVKKGIEGTTEQGLSINGKKAPENRWNLDKNDWGKY